jgi:hypothetical protein
LRETLRDSGNVSFAVHRREEIDRIDRIYSSWLSWDMKSRETRALLKACPSLLRGRDTARSFRDEWKLRVMQILLSTIMLWLGRIVVPYLPLTLYFNASRDKIKKKHDERAIYEPIVV